MTFAGIVFSLSVGLLAMCITRLIFETKEEKENRLRLQRLRKQQLRWRFRATLYTIFPSLWRPPEQ